jgi:hypothetical protein
MNLAIQGNRDYLKIAAIKQSVEGRITELENMIRKKKGLRKEDIGTLDAFITKIRLILTNLRDASASYRDFQVKYSYPLFYLVKAIPARIVKPLFATGMAWQPICVIAWLANIHVADPVVTVLAIISIAGLALLVTSFIMLCAVDDASERLMERGLCDACKQIYRDYKDGKS